MSPKGAGYEYSTHYMLVEVASHGISPVTMSGVLGVEVQWGGGGKM